jgi:hypothetical protein
MQYLVMAKISSLTSQKLRRLVKNEHFTAILVKIGFLVQNGKFLGFFRFFSWIKKVLIKLIMKLFKS